MRQAMVEVARGRSSSRILVVDDDESLRENLAELLAAEGYDVRTAANAAEALASLERQAIDLILTDYRMPPGPSGVDLVEAARAKDPRIRGIVMTAFGDGYVEIESVRRGATGYLPKPFEVEDVTGLVRKILSLEGE